MIVCLFIFLLLTVLLIVDFSIKFVFYLINLLIIYLLVLIPVDEEIKILWGSFYIDILSLSLVILSLYLIFLIIMSRHGVKKRINFFALYSCIIIILLLTLLLRFFRINFLSFYFFFEFSLIPTIIIIIGWGYQPERLQAGIYFILYTLVASLPLLINILLIYKISGRLWIVKNERMFFLTINLENFLAKGLRIFLVLAFFVKIPIFFVHLWLPKAHVEAPVAGSMILAGVLLKLGGYGICRILSFFYPFIKWLRAYIIGLRILGIVFIGVSCCRINDMKALVAYSSVAHMGLVLSGLLTFYTWGLNGGLMIMLRHGLVSSGLFCSVNIFYERLRSRRIFINKGLISILPIFCLLVFLLCCFNISAPPSINLISEIFLIVSVVTYDKLILLFFPLGSFIGAVFTFYIFSYSQHGKLYNTVVGIINSLYIECHLIILHILPVVFIILVPGVLIIYL